MPVSFVTPSTSPAPSSPKDSRTSSSDALVSSTMSCSSAAHSVAVSSRRPAQIFATPGGRVMKSRRRRRRGPQAGADLRDAQGVIDEVLARVPALVGMVLTGEHERALHLAGVDGLGG